MPHSAPLIRTSYRADIDGLRAIAILAVVLFHFGWHALAGGFLGVDIFFVISGFLITQLLSQPSALSWRARLGNFYLRRARRILPALLTTSLVVAAAAAVIYLPDDLRRIGKYLVFTPLMLANLPNWLDGGYFATGGPFFPLKHYWSLAVEEQFYIVYPLVFLALLPEPVPKRRIGVLAALAVVSIAICILGEYRHSSITFYLMPARMWELMFGALAAECAPLRLNSRIATELAAYGCLAVVTATFFVFDEATAFPNPYVLIPCAATAALLSIGRHPSTTVFKLLAIRPLVFTGRISYSLYLWHVPILAFVQYYAIRRLSDGALLALGVAIYCTAVLSYMFIEDPTRRRVAFKADRGFVLAALATCIAVGATGACLWSSRGLPWRFDRDVQVLIQPDQLPHDAERCMSLPLQRVAAGGLCRFGPDHAGVRTAVLWGDSHALVLLPAFEALAQANDVRIDFGGRSSCQPLLDGTVGAETKTKQDDCNAFNNAMVSAVQRIHPDVTILSAFWGMQSAQSAQSAETRSAPALTRDQKWNWAKTIVPLRASGSMVCVVLDVPYLLYAAPYALAMARRKNLDPSFIYMKRSDVEAQYSVFEESVRAEQATNAVIVADPKIALCPGMRCEIESNGRLLYRDSNHLSRAGAMFVRRALEPCLARDDDSPRD